jgi:hypothetical protein
VRGTRKLLGKSALFGVALCWLYLSIGQPCAAQDPQINEIKEAWANCEAALREYPDRWIGWRHNFLNGYGEDFQFYDNRELDKPSVLVVGTMIDAIAFVTDTSCFRPNESLAFIFSVMDAPNVNDPGDKSIRREGRIYFDASGNVVRVLGWVADSNGTKLGDLNDRRFELARDCTPVSVHLKVDQVETHYFSVLGDIEGIKPKYTEKQFDWCSVAKSD